MITILGTGRALPARCVRSDTFDERIGKPVGYLAETTGVAARYVCEAESQIDLAEIGAFMAQLTAQPPADTRAAITQWAQERGIETD